MIFVCGFMFVTDLSVVILTTAFFFGIWMMCDFLLVLFTVEMVSMTLWKIMHSSLSSSTRSEYVSIRLSLRNLSSFSALTLLVGSLTHKTCPRCCL